MQQQGIMNEDQDLFCQMCSQIQLWFRKPTAFLTFFLYWNSGLICEYCVAVFGLLGIL